MAKKFTLMKRNDLQLMVHVVQLVKTSIFTGLCKQGCRTGLFNESLIYRIKCCDNLINFRTCPCKDWGK